MTTAMTTAEAESRLASLAGWRLVQNGKRIRKDFPVSNFLAGLEFFNRVAVIAEEMQHHPDVHLENYRDAWIEIWTHTVDGLSESDFVLAQRIDSLND